MTLEQVLNEINEINKQYQQGLISSYECINKIEHLINLWKQGE